jgi:hypothetical protein
MAPEGVFGGGRDAGCGRAGSGSRGGGKQLNSCGQYHQFGNCNTNNAHFHKLPTDKRGKRWYVLSLKHVLNSC